LTLPPPGQAKLQGADASHAWISVWDPLFGWVDFDPTNGMMPAETHITLAYGRDYNDVSPISGVLLGGGEQRMDVAVDVTLAG
jgi:transglutaminase-like putative cysteine protease